MKILLHGCNGRMGQVITKLSEMEGSDFEIVCGVDRDLNKFENNYPVYGLLEQVPDNIKADALIDFSHHDCIEDILSFGKKTLTPLVICTSGFTQEEQNVIREASEAVPILMSANMSLGINLLLALVEKSAPILRQLFDIEIVEKHHNQKLDSPSGTAMMIAEAIDSSLGNTMEFVYGRHGREASLAKRKENEIGIHSVRGGALVGEHNVVFAGQGETLEIKHTALSRDVFAYGAIKAAGFLIGKTKGFYSMKDVVEAKN